MSAGPLSAVLAQLEAGTPTIAEMARRSGLGEPMVRAAMDHLIRIGRVEAKGLSLGCPPKGCGDCSVSDCGPAPDAAAFGQRKLVGLSLVRR